MIRTGIPSDKYMDGSIQTKLPEISRDESQTSLHHPEYPTPQEFLALREQLQQRFISLLTPSRNPTGLEIDPNEDAYLKLTEEQMTQLQIGIEEISNLLTHPLFENSNFIKSYEERDEPIPDYLISELNYARRLYSALEQILSEGTLKQSKCLITHNKDAAKITEWDSHGSQRNRLFQGTLFRFTDLADVEVNGVPIEQFDILLEEGGSDYTLGSIKFNMYAGELKQRQLYEVQSFRLDIHARKDQGLDVDVEASGNRFVNRKHQPVKTFTDNPQGHLQTLQAGLCMNLEKELPNPSNQTYVDTRRRAENRLYGRSREDISKDQDLKHELTLKDEEIRTREEPINKALSYCETLLEVDGASPLVSLEEIQFIAAEKQPEIQTFTNSSEAVQWIFFQIFGTSPEELRSHSPKEVKDILAKGAEGGLENLETFLSEEGLEFTKQAYSENGLGLLKILGVYKD